MPPSVQAEADTESRRIVVSPLPKHTVAAMADAFGLAQEISRDEVYRVGSGHPLATRYLLEQLIAADDEARESLLAETQPFGGDLEVVYEAAWRGIEQVREVNSVRKVLALLGLAEGRIVPEALASATSDEAVETALRNVRHLLDLNGRGWRVFHNSFRLFIQRKPVLRFGNPDPDFSASAIYQKLADLVDVAPEENEQKWLKFRYLFLAGHHEAALSLASRTYFVDQYCAGRRAYVVRREISDGLKCLVDRDDAVKLFDLMLADDEIGRRSNVMDLVTSVVDAHLAIGDLDAAYDALQQRYEDGKQWMVVDALLDAGKVELAREIFEDENPFAFLSSRPPPYRGTNAWEAFPWAQRAIVFLDDEQIDRRISSGLAAIALKDEYGNEGLTDNGAEEAAAAIKFQVARALIESDPTLDLADVQARWAVSSDRPPVLQLEAAIAASRNGDAGKSDSLLREALSHSDVDRLHSSWFLSASRAAFKNKSLDLARAYAELVSIPNLAEIERSIQSDKLDGAAKQLVEVIELRVSLGLEIPQLENPKERLLKGVQHHLVTLGAVIGRIRSGEAVPETETNQLAATAITFLATSGLPDDPYSSSGNQMPRMAETILKTVFRLLRQGNSENRHVLETIDRHLDQGKPPFRWWHSFRRCFAILGYQFDRDTDKAMARLHAGLADLGTTYNPEEEIEEKAAYAEAIARVGRADQAREILSTLRRDAYGTYLAAKKDGQYELWASTLSNANKQDPEHRADRAVNILRLADGLTHTEGNDSAWRMGRQILYEATAATPEFAYKAARWALNSDILSWDGIIDAVLRGLLERDSSKALAALLAWAHLSLPWYDEPHGSTTATGQFLKDLMAKADKSEIGTLEAEAATAIVRLAQPSMKFDLLKILEEAARLRGFGEASSAASIEVGAPRENSVDEDPEHKSYRHVIDLENVAEASLAEAEYFKTKNKAEKSSYRRVTYGLRRAAVRVIGHSQWSEIAKFIDAHPDLAVDNEVKEAAAKVAIAAGQSDAARALFADVLNSEGEGWGWASGRERQRLHEVRHVLGEPGAYERARQDFTSDMANARYGVGTALMEADAIFPMLFERVAWPEIWDRLETQFKTTREFQLGNGVSAESGCSNDSDLLAALFVEGFTLGVPVLNVEAGNGALHLLDQRQDEVFATIVERLLGSDGECRMMAMELITLAADPDAGVAAAATFLAEKWGEPIQYERLPLPAIYQLELPDHDSSYGNPAADEHTRGLVIEDTFGWTDPWEALVKRIARYGDVATANVRWRVGQLIQSWGGVAEFGHEGSKKLEDKLKRLSMGMAYRRPQSEVALRAFRYVVQELFLAGRISGEDWRLLLHKLRVDPSRVVFSPSSARPMTTNLPAVPRVIFGKERTAWAENVKEDLALISTVKTGKILAEWSQKTVRDIRVNITLERLTRISEDRENQQKLDEFLDDLPEVFGSGGVTPLYRHYEMSASRIACLNPHRLQGVPIAFLMLCPLAAAQLRWRHDASRVGLYHDTQGNEMARTIWWRDGLPQPVEQDQSWAEGQQVVLTNEGLIQFEKHFGPIETTTSAWRRVEADKNDGDCVEFFATDASAALSAI
jgi:hypothetical protein